MKSNKEIKSLSIDTSFEHCSLAVQIGDEINELCELTPKTHTQLILPMLQKILDNAKIKLTDLDFIAFGAGPGSFTSVRLATSLVQGLAFGAGLPVVAVSTLHALAKEIHDEYGAEYVFTGMDARMDEIYWGVYKFDDHGVSISVVDDMLAKPEAVVIPKLDVSINSFGAGSAWNVYQDDLAKRFSGKIEIKNNLFPRAKYIAKLAILAYSNNNFGDWHNALPVYLRDKVTYGTNKE